MNKKSLFVSFLILVSCVFIIFTGCGPKADTIEGPDGTKVRVFNDKNEVVIYDKSEDAFITVSTKEGKLQIKGEGKVKEGSITVSDKGKEVELKSEGEIKEGSIRISKKEDKIVIKGEGKENESSIEVSGKDDKILLKGEGIDEEGSLEISKSKGVELNLSETEDKGKEFSDTINLRLDEKDLTLKLFPKAQMKSGIKQKIEYGENKWNILKFAAFLTEEKPEEVEKHFKEEIRNAEVISEDGRTIIKGKGEKEAVFYTVTIYKNKEDGKTLFTINEN